MSNKSLSPRSREQRSKTGNNIVNQSGHLMERFNNRFSVNNPWLGERYDKAELHILLHFRFRDSEEYVACFQRDVPDTHESSLKIRNGIIGPTSPETFNKWLFRLFSGIWSQVQAATVKVDRVGKVLFVPKTSCRVLHPLNLSVDGLAGGVGHSMAQIGDDVLESALQHSTHLDHGLQPAAHRPVVPPAEVLARRTLIDVIEQRHRGLLQGPGSCRFQSAVPKLSKILAVLGFHAGRVPQPVIARAG